MQLQDLVKPIEESTDAELLERLAIIRNNRTTVRPAGAARAKRAAGKGKQARVNKVDALLAMLSPEELEKFMADMGESAQ